MQLKFLIFIFILTCNFALANPSKKEIRLSGYLFDEVIITGTTNVNSFRLWYSEDHYTNLPQFPNQALNQLKIRIPAIAVESESKLMLHDFLQMINVKKHPAIIISLDRAPAGEFDDGDFVEQQICLAMNGLKKEYHCLSEIISCREDEICLKGKVNVLLTDFGIDPPRKFFGIVKVKNEVFISFRLSFSTEKKETKN